MKRRLKATSLALVTGIALVTGTSSTQLIAMAEETSAKEAENPSHVSVHDPEIIQAEDGSYYILGTHTASAHSDDLIHWEQLNRDYQNKTDAPFYGNLLETFARPFEWAGYDDGDCSGKNFAIWAPDIIWNPYYEWEDGDTGAYMLYCSNSSTWRRSCISLLVSKSLDETFTYKDTLIYSGFTTNGRPDGNSTRDTSWDNSYLNLNELLARGSENNGIDEISPKWFSTSGDWNNAYAPNAIDANPFFDADGTHLYLSYGSWSGGIFLLELDPTTGEALYPGVDGEDEVSGNFIDRYFGTHLAGGYHQSGEGPYIYYDDESEYYYLYETYGGLTANGGYNMRLFRSQNPTGPYLDAKGQNAAENKINNEKYGIKLIGNYCFDGQLGKRAAGHNSVLRDTDGSRYLVYHQRFDTTPSSEAHEVRIHQQFLNEDLWPVTAVYEYSGQTPSHYEDADVIGTYEFINHGTRSDSAMIQPDTVELLANGTVSGAVTGTWTKTDSGRGYDYFTLTSDEGTVYKGYFFYQQKETYVKGSVMTFSAIGDDNTCIWGSKTDKTDSEQQLT